MNIWSEVLLEYLPPIHLNLLANIWSEPVTLISHGVLVLVNVKSGSLSDSHTWTGIEMALKYSADFDSNRLEMISDRSLRERICGSIGSAVVVTSLDMFRQSSDLRSINSHILHA